MPARVSAFTRWNDGAVDSQKTPFGCVALDQFRREVLSQGGVYENSVRSFLDRCLQGCSGSIITYGAWGSGKSYTLGALDPQQISLPTPANESPGVLSRCTQQLFEWLGEDAAVEITCVEVLGDDVVDLLDQRGPSGRRPSSDGLHGSSGSTSGATGCTSPSPSHSNSQGGFSRSPIAAAAASTSRRKPLTTVIARSLTEALMTLKRAVVNRQAFVTVSRHNSSRTHAVFQLRWRNPTGQAAGGCTAASAMTPGPTGRSSGGGAAQRAFSAPPRSSLTALGGCPPGAARAADSGGGGPVCTLTLIDTCSFCPLLPPKEASAVKRALLALGRVLNALQRRQALTLRESKLTRMLEGAVDQVLLLACLGGIGDETTVELVKMLEQGARESALQRSRRASSSDSRQGSGGWESISSLCGVSATSLVNGNVRHSQLASSGEAAASTAATPPQANPEGLVVKAGVPLLGIGPSRALFHSPGSPISQAYGVRRAVADRIVSPLVGIQNSHDSAGATAPADGARHGGGFVTAASSGGGGSGDGATDTNAIPMPPMSDILPDASSSSPTGSSRCCDDGDGGVSVRTSRAELPLAEMAKGGSPVALSNDVESTDAPLCSPDGPSIGGSAALENTPLSWGGRRAGRTIPSPPGMSSPLSASNSRKLSALAVSSRQKPASCTARAPPSPEVRRSQGFSVLLGKWAPPPRVSPRDKTFPVVPCVVAASDGTASPASSLRSSMAPAGADSAGSVAVAFAGSPTRSSAGTSLHARASPGRVMSRTGASPRRGSPGSGSAQLKRVSRDSQEVSSRSAGGGGGAAACGAGYTSPFVTGSPDATSTPGSTGASPSHATVATVSRAPTAATGSPAAATAPTSARRRSNIPGRPPVRSPQQPSPQSPFAAAANAAAASASPAAAPCSTQQQQRPLACNTSPTGAATLISLAEVPPRQLTSTRYNNANVSRDSVPENIALAASAAASAISALLAAPPADMPPASWVRVSLRRQQLPSGAYVAADGLTRDGDTAAAGGLRRSMSSGLRWPSPLLRARRAEWLADTRRSRSALPRPVTGMPEPRGGTALSPRKPPHGFRCAPSSRPTLSAQYKDLLLDFEAFKARERTPRNHRSAMGAATPPIASVKSAGVVAHAGSTDAEPSPDRPRLPESKTSPAGLNLSNQGSASKPGSTVLPARAAAMVAAAISPAGSIGLPPGSSSSTPHSARHASGGCTKPPPLFSRAHSPSADEGLMSLTAAAAVAAASPRTPVSGGALQVGRPRPGVSRTTATTVSPRPLLSPERPATPVSPATVLDMSRLCVAKGSPTTAGTPPQPPQPPSSTRCRLSAGSGTAAATPGQLASGGSDRYKRLAEEADSVQSSEDEADSEQEQDCGHSDGVQSSPSGDSVADRDNLLGPGCLEDLGIMLDTGGNAVVLNQTLSQRGEPGRTSPAGLTPPSHPCTSARAAATAAATAAPSSSSEEGDWEGTNEELPAVSFFIRFPSRVHALDGNPATALGPATTTAAPSMPGDMEAAAAQENAADVSPVSPADTHRSPDARPAPIESAQEAPSGSTQTSAGGGHCPQALTQSVEHEPGQQQDPLPEPEHAAEQHQPRHVRPEATGRAPVAVAAAAAAAVAELAEFQRSYISQGRASIESAVLRGSCTPFALDLEGGTACSYDDGPASPPAQQLLPAEEQEEEDAGSCGEEREEEDGQRPLEELAARAGASVYAEAPQGKEPMVQGLAVGKPGLGSPAHSSISLVQLLQQQLQEQQLQRQQQPLQLQPLEQQQLQEQQLQEERLLQQQLQQQQLQQQQQQLQQQQQQLQQQQLQRLQLQQQQRQLQQLQEQQRQRQQLQQQQLQQQLQQLQQQQLQQRLQLQQQQELQQRPGRRMAAWMAAGTAMPTAVVTEPAAACQKPTPSARVHDQPGCLASPQAASRQRAQRAHVQSNYMDLDEHSNVLIDVDSASESDASALATADTPRQASGSGPRASRPSVGLGSALASAATIHHAAAISATPSRPSAPLPEPPPALATPSPRKPSSHPSPQPPPPTSLSQNSFRDRVAALEVSQSPVTGTKVAPCTPLRLMQSWTHEDGEDGGSLGSAATVTAAVPPPGGSSDGACHGAAYARSALLADAALPVGAVADMLRKPTTIGSGSGRRGMVQRLLGGIGAEHRRLPSADSPMNHTGPMGRCAVMAAASGAASRPLAKLPVNLARSIEDEPGARRASPRTPAPVPPSQQHQQQQVLRGSGNVAAAWRAAAAMSTSSSSVRSCFRSNSGQHHSGMLGTDAIAVATVVASSRATPACSGEGKHALSTTSGHAAVAPVHAAKLSGGEEQLWSSGAAITATATTASPPTALPRPSHLSTTHYAARLAPSEPRTQAHPGAREAAAANRGFLVSPILAKTKSARNERLTPLTARLWGFKSYRTPRAAAATATTIEAAGPQQPPPPAYPPGFVSWAAKLFSGNRKSKQAL